MVRQSSIPGHVLERQSDIRKYLEEPWVKRPTGLWPGDQPWDNDMMDSFEMARSWKGLSAAQQVDNWHRIMDEYDIEKAICFPTGSGNIAKNQEVPYQIAVARAANTQFAKEFNSRSDRLSCVGCLPMRSPKAAAEELRRSVTSGLKVLKSCKRLTRDRHRFRSISRKRSAWGWLSAFTARQHSRALGTSDCQLREFTLTRFRGILLRYQLVCRVCRALS